MSEPTREPTSSAKAVPKPTSSPEPQPTIELAAGTGSASAGSTPTELFSRSQIMSHVSKTDVVGSANLRDRTLGEFRLLRRLGGGGMAEVWLAEQTSLRRQVAIKVMRPDIQADELCRKRFEQEALATAGLNHPNIVQVYAVGESNGIRFIAQEYVAGMNMRDYIAKKGPPSAAIALHLLKQVASALQAAAEAGIVHRDIKPENILLTRKGVAKVVDFGLAQLALVADMRLTQAGMTMGTPLYMSPEQVQGHKVDQRSDLYSLGATFYHLLTGQPPFRGESALAIAYHQVHTAPAPLNAVRPDVPPPLAGAILRMLAKKPEDRFPSAESLLQELRKIDKQAVADGTLSLSIEPQMSQQTVALATNKANNWTAWLRPSVHPWVAFLIWGVVIVSAGAAVGSRTARRAPVATERAPAKVVRTERQPTITQQLESARRENTEDAWWAVLLLWEEESSEKHLARQELIPRLLQQQRFAEAERLSREILADPEAPKSAKATAWAAQALGLVIRGQWTEAERITNEHLRAQFDAVPRPLAGWLNDAMRRRRGSQPPPVSRESDASPRRGRA
jgi:serine/threonine-protein kinase